MRGVAFLLVLAGCNQVFDLERTNLEPDKPGLDTDGDGIEDIDDNCRVDSNADQADSDEDGFGNLCDPCVNGPQSLLDDDHDGVDNACDPCLTGENSDEDQDGFLDGCDVCPADPEQADGDGDGVGDACDPSQTQQQKRAFFDGFARALPGWNGTFIDWTVSNGTFGPDETSPQILGPWRRDATVAGTAWQLTAVVDLSATPPQYNDQVGLIGFHHAGTTAFICAITYQGTQGWRLAGSAVTVTDVDRITVLASPGGNGIICVHNGVSIALSASPIEPISVGLVSTQLWRFRWLDAVQ